MRLWLLLVLLSISGIPWALFVWVIGGGDYSFGVTMGAGIVTGALSVLWVLSNLCHRAVIRGRDFIWSGVSTYYLAITIFFAIATPIQVMSRRDIQSIDIIIQTGITIWYGYLWGTIIYGWTLIPLAILHCWIVWKIYQRATSLNINMNNKHTL